MATPVGASGLQAVIRDIQVGFSTFYALVLTPRDVSMAQFAVLLCLAQAHPRKMSEISKALHVSMPAVTHLVDRLQRKRMIRRQPHPTDRRVTLIDLTSRGRALVAETQGRTLRILTSAFTHRSPAERKAIFEFMGSLRSGLRQAITNAS